MFSSLPSFGVFLVKHITSLPQVQFTTDYYKMSVYFFVFIHLSYSDQSCSSALKSTLSLFHSNMLDSISVLHMPNRYLLFVQIMKDIWFSIHRFTFQTIFYTYMLKKLISRIAVFRNNNLRPHFIFICICSIYPIEFMITLFQCPIWFYMCSTVQSPQTVLNGVINLLSWLCYQSKTLVISWYRLITR